MCLPPYALHQFSILYKFVYTICHYHVKTNAMFINMFKLHFLRILRLLLKQHFCSAEKPKETFPETSP